MSNPAQSLPDALREKFKANNLRTDSAKAEKIDISVPTMVALMNGDTTRPSADIAKKVSAFLEIDTSEFWVLFDASPKKNNSVDVALVKKVNTSNSFNREDIKAVLSSSDRTREEINRILQYI